MLRIIELSADATTLGISSVVQILEEIGLRIGFRCHQSSSHQVRSRRAGTHIPSPAGRWTNRLPVTAVIVAPVAVFFPPPMLPIGMVPVTRLRANSHVGAGYPNHHLSVRVRQCSKRDRTKSDASGQKHFHGNSAPSYMHQKRPFCEEVPMSEKYLIYPRLDFAPVWNLPIGRTLVGHME